jgi:3-oxoacyl-[acyl-carrier protein] reductase
MLLEGRVALVTGASRGIGAAIARAFAAEGAALLLSARSEGVEEIARELSEGGRPARAMRGDVSDPNFARELITSVRKEHGRLDLLVNNAGVLQEGRIGMIAIEQMRTVWDVNVLSMMALTQYAVRIMDSTRSPSIVNLSSIAATQGMVAVSAYAASKGAVVGYTRSSAKELAPKGIRVNAIAPGFIDTDMTRGMPPDLYQQRLGSIAMGRIGTPEDVAGVAVFLGSDLSRYVTGQVIGVDGGMAS